MQNRLYALQARQDQEGSPDVVTVTLRVFDLDVYSLLDPRDFLSFVTPYIAVKFSDSLVTLSEPISVSTPVGNPVITRLVELEIVDFDVILGIDWLLSCYTSIDCRTMIVHFNFQMNQS